MGAKSLSFYIVTKRLGTHSTGDTLCVLLKFFRRTHCNRRVTVCNSANVKCPVYLCVCDHVCTCSRVIVHAHILLTHFLINTRTYVRIPGGQSIIRSSRSCRGRCVTIVRTRPSADTDAHQSLFGKQGRTSQARKPGERSKLTKNGACTLTNTAAEAADGARRRRASGLAC